MMTFKTIYALFVSVFSMGEPEAVTADAQPLCAHILFTILQ